MSDHREKEAGRFPIDGEGKPTSREAYLVISKMFAERRDWHLAKDLASSLRLNAPVVEAICRDLALADILVPHPARIDVFRYNLSCSRMRLQAGLETALIDELDCVKVRPLAS